MDIRPLKTAEDHEAALREIERLWRASEGSAAGERLDALATLVDAYEKARWPVASLDPVERSRQRWT